MTEENHRMTEEKLIEEVREFPCIWDTSSRSYKDQRARENAWKLRKDLLVVKALHMYQDGLYLT